MTLLSKTTWSFEPSKYGMYLNGSKNHVGPKTTLSFEPHIYVNNKDGQKGNAACSVKCINDQTLKIIQSANLTAKIYKYIILYSRKEVVSK